MKIFKTMASWLVGSALLGCIGAVQAANIAGAGSSAAAPIYRSWAGEYAKESGVTLDYEPIGSSAGVKKIRAGGTGFGASDVAPSQADLDKDALVLIPVAITGVAPVIHLPKGGDVELRLTGEVLARIFLGSIKQWNAPEIVQLNPGVALRDWPIRVVVRSDGSGTTHNFADYLAKVSPEWKSQRGVKSSYVWPASFLAVKGSDGVVKAVRETSGAIGYVDYGYVRENKLHVAALRNSAGEFVLPSTASFRSALSNSDWVSRGSFGNALTDKAGLATWPITMGTFVLFPKITDQPEMTMRALQFFVWAFLHGDSLVQKNNFVRLPDRIQAAAFKAITSVRDRTGRTLPLSLEGTLAQ